MKPLPEILMLLICTIICQGAVISPSDQQEVLDYESKITVLHGLLKTECGTYPNLTYFLSDNLTLLKIRYQRILENLLECHKEKTMDKTEGKAVEVLKVSL